MNCRVADLLRHADTIHSIHKKELNLWVAYFMNCDIVIIISPKYDDDDDVDDDNDDDRNERVGKDVLGMFYIAS